MKNLKDTISTICAVIFALSSAIVTGVTGVALPEWLTTTAAFLMSVSGAVLGVLIGRNPDLTKKTNQQINKTLASK